MSRYDKIDSLIVQAIKSGSSTLLWIFRGVVRAEADRLHEEDRKVRKHDARSAILFVHSRLQALRKRGLIVHVRGWGWRAQEAA